MAHAITPTARDTAAPLTKTADVLAVLKAGGCANQRTHTNLWDLYDRDGRLVPAWQNAVRAALKQLEHVRRLAAHFEFIDRVKANGKRVVSYAAPCCGKEIETQAAWPEGEVWDSLSMCPWCAEMHMKVTHHDRVIAAVPEES